MIDQPFYYVLIKPWGKKGVKGIERQAGDEVRLAPREARDLAKAGYIELPKDVQELEKLQENNAKYKSITGGCSWGCSG